MQGQTSRLDHLNNLFRQANYYILGRREALAFLQLTKYCTPRPEYRLTIFKDRNCTGKKQVVSRNRPFQSKK